MSWRMALVWAAVMVVASIVACRAPLTQSLGYEYALVVSLIATLGAGHLASQYPGRLRGKPLRFEDKPLGAFIMWFHILEYTAPMVVLPLLVGLVNGMRAPMCNTGEGLSFYVLLVVPGVLFATALGLIAGLSFESRKAAGTTWFALYGALLVAGICRFHGSPAVCLFGPLFGYFPGVLYDELVTVETRLLTYRIATLSQVVALLSFTQCFLEASSRRLAFVRRRWLSLSCVGVALAFGVAIAFYAAGPALGHRTTRGALEEELSLKRQAANLELHFSPTADPQVIEQLLEDATFSLHQVEEYLGVRVKDTITIFLFPDENAKGAAMGALGTNVAKPWRKEVYVTVEDPPHWVMRHEIAHAVAAEFGKGPFAVSGKAGGLLPCPGLIEGLAVAATGPRDEMTVHQWAAAMKHLKLLPSLEDVLGIGFFNVATSVAYVASGSFAHWIRTAYSPQTLRLAYRRGDYAAATGQSLEALERRWIEFLAKIELAQPEIDAARHRFDRPAVVHGVCIHEVARLRQQADALAATNQWDATLAVLKEANERSGNSTATRLDLFNGKIEAGRMGEVLSESALLLDDPQINSVAKDGIREVLADLEFATGNRLSAHRSFLELASRAPSELRRRALEIKAHLAEMPPAAVSKLPLILARRPGQSQVPEALALLVISDTAHQSPEDPVLWYLLGRQYFRYYDWDTAIQRFDRATALGIESVAPSLWLEIRMLKAQSLFRQRRYDEARILFEQIGRDPRLQLGMAALAQDWLQRCRFRSARPSESSRL
jgi:tetratricopeptide (TPR) repeat protein